jgi:NAD(P)H-flavin reductase
MIDSCTNLLTSEDPRLTSLITYSREGPVAEHERTGYVQDHLDECLECFDDLENVQVFVCGRPDMVKAVESILQQAGILREKITTEKY